MRRKLKIALIQEIEAIMISKEEKVMNSDIARHL